MGYEEELEPLVDALKAAGYSDDPPRESHLLRMKKPIDNRAIVVVVDRDPSSDTVPNAIAMRLHACYKGKPVDRNFDVSGIGTGIDFDKLIAKLEGELLASD